VARKGIDMLLEGAAYGPVKFLEKKKRELKESEMG
jgi:rRNA processing protein Krr1/Pno1